MHHSLDKNYQSLERYIPLFQAYLRSDNQTDFVKKLTDPNEKMIIEVLTDDITQLTKFKEKARTLGIDRSLIETLVGQKLAKYVKKIQKIGDNQMDRQIKSQFASRYSFQHPRPSTISADGPSSVDQQDKTPSSLTLDQSLEQYLIKKLEKKPSSIRLLNDYAVSKLPEDLLLKLPVQEKEQILEKFSIIYHWKPEFISKFIIKFEEEKLKSNKNYFITKNLLAQLTKDQINHLGKMKAELFNNQDYVEQWFNLNYSERMTKYVQGCDYFTKQDYLNKREEFRALIKDLSAHKHIMIKSYIRKLKEEIIYLDLIVGDPDINTLIDHLKTSCITTALNGIERSFAQRKEGNIRSENLHLDKFQPKMRYNLEVEEYGIAKAIQDYISKLFKISKDDNQNYIKKLSQFFRKDYLTKLNVNSLLARGIIPKDVNNYFSAQELQTLKNKKEITLHSTNKRQYKAQDEVQIYASVKNVKTIHIKIYELNLTKHLLTERNRSFDENSNLAFLKPTSEHSYQLKFKNQYEVDDNVCIRVPLDKKMGVFYVDLQGQTVTSRAMIKKGAILCMEQFTQAGQRFSFFDQNGKPLNSALGLKVWISGRPVDLKKNNYFDTLYGEKDQYANITASLGNMAQNFQKKIIQEKYNFNIGYIYNAQSFIVGKKAKIILHGRLTMNNSPMSLQLLKNIKASVNVVNNQGISTFYEFNFKKWRDDEDQIIQFPVQSYLSDIVVSVNAKIELQTKKQIQVNSLQNIQIDLNENSQNFMDFYMEKDKKQHYVLNLLGANGQPIPNTQIIVIYTVKGISEQQHSVLKTDSNGKIHLGSLSICQSIAAQLENSEGRISRFWQLSKADNKYSFPEEYHIKIGQSLSFPVDPSWTKNDFTYLRTFDKYHADDCSDQIQINNGRLSLPALKKEGYYILKILPINKYIDIWTLKDLKWEGDTDQKQIVFDHEDGHIFSIRNNVYKNIAVNPPVLTDSGDTVSGQVKIDLPGLSQQQKKKVRIHAFANNYLAPQVKDMFNPSQFTVQPSCSKGYTGMNLSNYYSNKMLSDQMAYVWNRQSKKQTHIGNNLEKPGIFLKRTLVRQTNQQDQHLSGDQQYQDESAMTKGFLNCGAIKKKKAAGQHAIPSRNVPSQLNCHNNFLLLSGHVETNIKGQTSFTVNVPKNYNQLQIFVLTPSSAIKQTFSLKTTENRKFKDLRHAGIQQTSENKGWTMSRQIYQLKKGEQITVNRNSQWRTVGLKDIFQFSKAKNVRLFEWCKQLLEWHNFSEEKKRNIYDKQCCHELNTFIKFKDPQFYQKVVKKHIENKICKTFVDYCLLDDVEEIRRYIKLDKFIDLNPFEKVMLVHTLVKNKELHNQAKNIVEMLEMYQDSHKSSYQEFKVNFDTIINAKALNEEGDNRIEERATRMVSRAKQVHQGRAYHRQKIEYKMAPRSASYQQQQYQDEQQQMFARSGPRNMAMRQRAQNMATKKAFIPIQSTKQYTERTYYNVKNYKTQARTLVHPTSFWSALARYFLQGHSTNFLSKQFMSLSRPIDFVLAACFISGQSSSNFDLDDQGQNYKLTARSPMLLYVKEVKQLDYVNKFGVQMNQRFLDPQNKFIFEDGMKIEKEVEQFVVNKPYICQTVVTNTSGTPLEMQILVDIPKGTIPLRSHQYTQITNIVLNAFTSKQFTRYFYAPSEGHYPIYPSNACRGSTIIAKSALKPDIVVKKYHTINKLQSFSDILRSGDHEKIIDFIKTKNIFDRNVFNPESILWMLKDKIFYEKVIKILRQRKFYNQYVWSFAFFHNDILAIRQIIDLQSNSSALQPEVFEYFPYYSTRTHQFANQTKSTIRNVQFKQTYLKFLTNSIVHISEPSSFAVSFAYFLILQDRLRQAQDMINSIITKYPNKHQIQVDYMRCFLDMSLNTHNFSSARQIAAKYKDYPVESWAKLFNQVRKTLEAEDEQFVDLSEDKKLEEFQTQIIQQSQQFKIIQPADTTVIVQFFQVNLDMMVSQFPFSDRAFWYTFIKPSLVKEFKASPKTQQAIIKRSDYPNITDATIEITQSRQGLPLKKVSSFTWANPRVKVKINQNAGTLQVFVDKKKRPGAYVKVYSMKSNMDKFYRDGYTDMTGTFRYAMSDLDGITQFAILVQTDKGGCFNKVKPPSKLASY